VSLNRSHLAALLAVTTVALPVYLLRLNGVAGMVNDDAWYILLARSLAEGTGFHLISSPLEPILPLYPPGFPAVLSIAFRISPEYPDNVWLLKGVSIAAMIGVGFLTYHYLRTRRLSNEVAISAALATILTPAFVFLATSTVMSECVFTLAQVAVILVVHRSAEANDRNAVRWLIVAAVLAAAAVLIRTAAVAVVAATAIWLLKERRWRRAAIFAATVALCLLPWIIHSTVNAPTEAQRAAHGGAVAYSYGEQLWMRWAGAPSSGTITARDLPRRVVTNLTDIAARGMDGIFLPVVLRGPAESGDEVVALGPGNNMGATSAPMIVAAAVSVIVLTGFIAAVRRQITVTEVFLPAAMAIILLWPFWSFRFVVPLTPFLYFYLVTGMQVLFRSPRAAPLVVLCVIGLALYDHAGYIIRAQSRDEGQRIEWIARARETDTVLEWIRDNLPGDGMIASSSPALLFMRTGLKSVAYDDTTIPFSVWKSRGFRYIVCLRPAELPPGTPGTYTVLHRSPQGLWVISI
jgi:hypothetical protein